MVEFGKLGFCRKKNIWKIKRYYINRLSLCSTSLKQAKINKTKADELTSNLSAKVNSRI